VSNHIPIGKIRQTSNTTDTFFRSVKNHSFSGQECIIMRQIWPSCIDLVFPPEEVEAGSAVYKERVQRYKKVWEVYTRKQDGVWAVLNDLSITGKDKAAKLRKVAQEFADIWVACFNDTTTLYMHLLLVHYPDQIEKFDIDPWFLQLQGLEHNNKIRKDFARTMCNNHIPGNQAMVTVDSYLNSKGTRVKEHSRWTGPCMSYVLMKNIIVSDHINHLLASFTFQSKSMEATRRTKVTTAKARELRIEENLLKEQIKKKELLQEVDE
jgi:hypothetical protein